MTGLARLLQLLAIVIWVGGIVFFAFVLAPTAFHTLPSVHLAGSVVGAALRVFDVVALITGVVFLLATAWLFSRAALRVRGRYEMEFLLAGLMLVATAFIHWNILPAMDQDLARASGDIATIAPTDPVRLHFDKLHKRSERVEGGILFLGLAVVFLMSREHAVVE
jgi:uncharacterized membrane protein